MAPGQAQSETIHARAVAGQPRAPLAESRHADWLGRLLDAANVLSTASQLAPVPWIGPAVSIVVKLLEIAQVQCLL